MSSVTNGLVTDDGVFVWNQLHVWFVPREGSFQAFRDGARSNFTVDGTSYHWAWLCGWYAVERALHEDQGPLDRRCCYEQYTH